VTSRQRTAAGPAETVTTGTGAGAGAGPAAPVMPISERRQMAMIREMMNKEAATSSQTQTSGKVLC